MAINLTPEQLAAVWQQIQPQMRSGATGYGFNSGGQDYIATPMLNAQTQMDGYVGGITPDMLDEWRVYEDKGKGEADRYSGTEYTRYDTQGNNLGTDNWKDLSGMSLGQGLAFLASFALGGNALGSALGGTGGMFGPGGVFGANAGAANGMWDMIPEAATGTGPGSGSLFAQGFTDAGTAGGALDTAYASGAAGTPWTTLASGGVLPAGVGTASSITNAAKGLLKTAGSWGPLLAAGAGALAGSQENDQASTQERRMDPRLDPYFFGNGGLLNIAQQQLQKDLADRRGADAMKQMGLGLLSRPVAGNGFQLLTGRSIG